MSERPVRLVLDTSAILSYAKAETLHVGETITQVDETGAAFGGPIACLASAGGADATLLHMLTTHPVCELLTVEVEEWRQWAAMTDVLGRLDAAAALVAASRWVRHVGSPGRSTLRALHPAVTRSAFWSRFNVCRPRATTTTSSRRFQARLLIARTPSGVLRI